MVIPPANHQSTHHLHAIALGKCKDLVEVRLVPRSFPAVRFRPCWVWVVVFSVGDKEHIGIPTNVSFFFLGVREILWELRVQLFVGFKPCEGAFRVQGTIPKMREDLHFKVNKLDLQKWLENIETVSPKGV